MPYMSGTSATSNVRWVGINQAGRVTLQFLSVVTLSRLLPPADYGVMALATVVTNFAALFRDMGTSAALIQRQELTAQLLDSVFCINITFGVAIGVAAASFAPLAAWFFATHSVLMVLLALSIGFPIAAVGAPLLALLERSNAFREIAWIEVSSAFVGLATAVVAAKLGAGVYSFVLQSLITTIMSTVQLWRASHYRPGFSWHVAELRNIWGFSSNLVVFNVINYFVRNGDSALIGRFLGAVALGWYSVANRLLLFPLQNVTFVMSRALLPIYSRKQEELGEISGLYLRTLTLIAAVSAPLTFGLWAVRAPLIIVLMGPRWTPVVAILAWFAPMSFIQSLNSTTGTILSALGRTDTLRTLGLVATTILFGSFVIGLQFGMLGVVRAYFVATLIASTICLHVTLRKVNSDLLMMIRAVAAPTLCAAVMAGAVSFLNWQLTFLQSFPRLIFLILTGTTVYAGFLLIFCREVFESLLRVLRQ